MEAWGDASSDGAAWGGAPGPWAGDWAGAWAGAWAGDPWGAAASGTGTWAGWGGGPKGGGAAPRAESEWEPTWSSVEEAKSLLLGYRAQPLEQGRAFRSRVFLGGTAAPDGREEDAAFFLEGLRALRASGQIRVGEGFDSETDSDSDAGVEELEEKDDGAERQPEVEAQGVRGGVEGVFAEALTGGEPDIREFLEDATKGGGAWIFMKEEGAGAAGAAGEPEEAWEGFGAYLQ